MKEQQIATELDTSEVKNFDRPDDIREFPNGRIEMVRIGGVLVGRITLQPGWRWSESVQPIAKTESCAAPHLGYQLSGVIRVRMDDGTEFDSHAGDVFSIIPGHEAWVVGAEPVVMIDFQGMSTIAAYSTE